jgi:HEAT repeat protein
VPENRRESTLARVSALVGGDAKARRAAAVTFVYQDDALAGLLRPCDAVVRTLTQALRDEDRIVGWAAARLLRHSGDDEAQERLREALSDPDPEVRRLVARAIATTSSVEPAILEALAKVVRDPQVRVARAAAAALSASGEAAAVRILLDECRENAKLRPVLSEELARLAVRHSAEVREGLGSPDPFVRGGAAHALRNGPPEVAVPSLAAVLDDPDRSVRAAAASSIAKLAEEHTSPEVIDALGRASRGASAKVRLPAVAGLAYRVREPAALRLLLAGTKDRSAAVREVAYLGLDSDELSANVLPVLLAGADDPSPDVRDAVYSAMLRKDPSTPGVVEAVVRGIEDGRLPMKWDAMAFISRAARTEGAPGQLTTEALIRLLSSRDGEKRGAAVGALPLRSTVAVEALIVLLADPVDRIAARAAERLGRDGGEAGVDALIAGLFHPDRRVSATAVMDLKAAPPQYGDKLSSALNEPFPRVRAAVLDILVDTTGEDARPTAEGLLLDPAAVVRRTATRALDRLDAAHAYREQLEREELMSAHMSVNQSMLGVLTGAHAA